MFGQLEQRARHMYQDAIEKKNRYLGGLIVDGARYRITRGATNAYQGALAKIRQSFGRGNPKSPFDLDIDSPTPMGLKGENSRLARKIGIGVAGAAGLGAAGLTARAFIKRKRRKKAETDFTPKNRRQKIASSAHAGIKRIRSRSNSLRERG